MKVLVRKMQKRGLLLLEFIVGVLLTAVAALGIPMSVITTDASLMANPYVLGAVIVGILFFGLIGFFVFVRPYLVYRKFPDVQVETDGEYLYIHTKKEAKILLSDISEASVYVNLPYLLRKEFVQEFIIHFLSEKYGDVDLEIPGHGNYKLRFVSNAEKTADELISYIYEVINK